MAATGPGLVDDGWPSVSDLYQLGAAFAPPARVPLGCCRRICGPEQPCRRSAQTGVCRWELFRATTCRDAEVLAQPPPPAPAPAVEGAGGSGGGAGGVYVSVVLAGRHDDLRGDYAGRLQVPAPSARSRACSATVNMRTFLTRICKEPALRGPC